MISEMEDFIKKHFRREQFLTKKALLLQLAVS